MFVTPHTSIYSKLIDTTTVDAKIDIIRYEFGVIGLFFISLDDDFIIKLYDP